MLPAKKLQAGIQFLYCRRMTEVSQGRIVPQRGISNDDEATQFREPITLEEVTPSIIYLDENYCVINKPPGIRMDGNFPITIEKLVAKWTQRGVKEIKWMHQLDFATSGILCIGLHREAVAAVVSSFEHRSVRKAYLSVLQGHLRVEDWPEMAAGTLVLDEQSLADAVAAEVGRNVVEQHRKALVSTGRNPKRKLQEVGPSDVATEASNPDSNLSTTGVGSTWQEQVMMENLQSCWRAYQTLSMERVKSINPQFQADFEYLQQFSEQDFIKGPKLRKLLRKLLAKCAINVDLVSSTMSEATSVLPTAAAAVENAQAAKRSMPLTDDEVEQVCRSYRDLSRPEGPAIFRLQSTSDVWSHPSPDSISSVTSHASNSNQALQTLLAESTHLTPPTAHAEPHKPYHLLVDIPVAELDDDFRMEPGHARNPGKKAVTEVFVLAHGYYQGQPVTKVLMKPISGRRHQLRIHARCLGHPIVGDFTYNPLQKQMIAARNAAFQQFLRSNPTCSTGDARGGATIPSALRQEWDARVAERMMLHAFCISIPFPNNGRAAVPYKRKFLEAERFRHVLSQKPDLSQDAQSALKDAIKQEFGAYSTLQIRDMKVNEPLLDIATVDPFCFDADGNLTPVLPGYLQRRYES